MCEAHFVSLVKQVGAFQQHMFDGLVPQVTSTARRLTTVNLVKVGTQANLAHPWLDKDGCRRLAYPRQQVECPSSL
ncbi:hypothetical protein N7535_004532 [Penicillium sp. DV-2018c]|nr:hypothetical protein N7535_004532 [Penicillium sp. DV-2018c]